jgi:hypothetical protein
MARIVTTSYRSKRPPRRRKPVVLGVPAVVRAASKPGPGPTPTPGNPQPAPTIPANDDPKPAPPPAAERKSAIVTVRRHSRFGPAEDLAPDEVRRRADAAEAVMQDFKRQIAAKLSAGSPLPTRRQR